MAAVKAPTSESCGTCHFGVPRGDGVQACHRNAPRPMQTLTAEASPHVQAELRWPQVDADDWCGEYQEQAAR